jgi:hypothetical protein
MTIRAKFFCCEKKEMQWQPGGEVQKIVVLYAATGKGNEERFGGVPFVAGSGKGVW